MEILPIKLLTDEEAWIFGGLIVSLGKLQRAGLPIGNGIAVTPPNLHLKTVLEHYDFGKREIFEQSLILVKKEINSIPVPEILHKETGKQKRFLLDGVIYKSVKALWLALLNIWIEEIKQRLWKEGFQRGITEGLTPQTVLFVKKIEASGSAYFDPLSDDSVINIKTGPLRPRSEARKLHPNDLRKIHELVEIGNKKLFIPHEYEWIIDGGVKLVGLKPYTTSVIASEAWQSTVKIASSQTHRNDVKSTVKVFLDMSKGLVVEEQVDGIYISSEKIFDLNRPSESFENTIFKLVESAITFPDSPIFFKLADISEGMGKIRGALRLLHQKNLFDPMIQILDFARHKKGLSNIHIVVPFVRSFQEFLQIKRELAVKKLGRKNSLQLWLEVAVPENIINLEEYLIGGLDGVVLNMDELIAHLNGFDHLEGELTFYKNEVDGLLKFLEDGLKLMHKSKIPFIAVGSLILNPKVLEFLIEKGVFGIVLERFEVPSAHDLLRQAEKRMILRRSQ